MWALFEPFAGFRPQWTHKPLPFIHLAAKIKQVLFKVSLIYQTESGTERVILYLVIFVYDNAPLRLTLLTYLANPNIGSDPLISVILKQSKENSRTLP